MKILLINGGPHEKGATNVALEEVAKTLNENNIETEHEKMFSEQGIKIKALIAKYPFRDGSEKDILEK